MTVYDIIWLHVGFCHVYRFTMHIVCHLQVCFETWLVLFSSPHGSSKYCSFFFLARHSHTHWIPVEENSKFHTLDLLVFICLYCLLRSTQPAYLAYPMCSMHKGILMRRWRVRSSCPLRVCWASGSTRRPSGAVKGWWIYNLWVKLEWLGICARPQQQYISEYFSNGDLKLLRGNARRDSWRYIWKYEGKKSPAFACPKGP